MVYHVAWWWKRKMLILLGGPTTPCLWLFHGLQMMGDSLTHLAIDQCPCLQLHDIMQTCPNLVLLKTMDVDKVMPLLSSSICPKMKQLALYQQPERQCKHESMVDVLRRFPSLGCLKLRQCLISVSCQSYTNIALIFRSFIMVPQTPLTFDQIGKGSLWLTWECMKAMSLCKIIRIRVDAFVSENFLDSFV